ncbi:MAG: hypothetical protein EOP51_02910 [Sphingobacteriales bacterium]|nr:MAG: hypothetical protein EOP51_02910 [Sphingobacteriales bacterium]
MVNMENYEEYMLLYADGELNEAEEQELLAFVAQHPQLQEELKAYTATKLLPDTEMVYEGKNELMKSEPVKRTIAFDRRWIYTAAAACVAMILFFVFNNKENNNEPVVAKHTTEKTNRERRPVQPADTEEFHSTPVDPITVKQITAPQRVMVAQHNTAKEQTEPQQAPQETVIAKQDAPKPVVKENTQPIVIPQTKTEEEQLPVVVHNEPQHNKQQEPSAPREKDNLLEIIDRDRFEGAKMIAQAFDDKIEKVKNIKKQLKDTDVALKIGKREFLIVRL